MLTILADEGNSIDLVVLLHIVSTHQCTYKNVCIWIYHSACMLTYVALAASYVKLLPVLLHTTGKTVQVNFTYKLLNYVGLKCIGGNQLREKIKRENATEYLIAFSHFSCRIYFSVIGQLAKISPTSNTALLWTCSLGFVNSCCHHYHHFLHHHRHRLTPSLTKELIILGWDSFLFITRICGVSKSSNCFKYRVA